MKNFKSQVSIEYVMIIGLVLLVTIPLLYYAMRESNVNIKLIHAEDAINTLARAADTVYSIGPGTIKYVWVTMPIGVQGSSVGNRSVSISMTMFGGLSDIHASTKADLVGVIPTAKGQHKIKVEMLESGYVQFGSAEDTVPPIIIWTDPSGTINYNGIILRATTNEYSACRYDLNDIDYSSMSQPFVGSALTHERDIGTLAAGNHIYYARCADPSGNTMTESTIINFTIVLSGAGEPYENDAPVINLMSPNDNYKTNESLITFRYNVTDQSSILLCDFILNSIIEQTDYTITKNTTQLFTQVIDYGNHTWNVNCTDAHGNRNSSSIWNITTNATADLDLPIVTSISPLNNTERGFWLVRFYYNVSDVTSGIDHCNLNMVGTLDMGGSLDWSITDAPVLEDTLEEIIIPLFKANYTWNISCVDDSASANEGYSETWNLRVNVSAGEEAFLNSCAGYCGSLGYSSGGCKQNCGGACDGTCEPGGDDPWCPEEPTTHCCCYY